MNHRRFTPAFASRSTAHGFTLLELVVVITIISILVAVALEKLLPYLDAAERAAVLRIEGQLRSALVLVAAERIARGRSATITELEDSNPVNFLAEPPKNYLGELTNDVLAGVPVRHWYFDGGLRRLVYRLGEPYSRAESTIPREDPAFAVNVSFVDIDGDGRFEASRDQLYGVHLDRVAGRQWLAGVGNGTHGD